MAGRDRCGAGGLAPELDEAGRAGLSAALDAGEAILAAGGNALDAVEAAARVLEEDPCFNAGRGSVLAYDGHVELDAAIMDGRDRRCGAVAGLRSTRAPISAARAVMEQSPHVLMSYEGADDFACEAGWSRCPTAGSSRPSGGGSSTSCWPRAATRSTPTSNMERSARSRSISHGHVAAATSTGGLTAKRWGRIGDSPLIGAGTYADDRAAAVSATGLGEVFIRAAAAHELCARVRIGGAELQEALDGVLAEVKALGGNGGLIAVAPSGEAAWGFTTPGMYRGMAGPDGRQVAIYDEESER